MPAAKDLLDHPVHQSVIFLELIIDDRIGLAVTLDELVARAAEVAPEVQHVAAVREAGADARCGLRDGIL